MLLAGYGRAGSAIRGADPTRLAAAANQRAPCQDIAAAILRNVLSFRRSCLDARPSQPASQPGPGSRVVTICPVLCCADAVRAAAAQEPWLSWLRCCWPRLLARPLGHTHLSPTLTVVPTTPTFGTRARRASGVSECLSVCDFPRSFAGAACRTPLVQLRFLPSCSSGQMPWSVEPASRQCRVRCAATPGWLAWPAGGWHLPGAR